MYDVTSHFELLERDLAVFWEKQDVPVLVSHLDQENREECVFWRFNPRPTGSELVCFDEGVDEGLEEGFDEGFDEEKQTSSWMKVARLIHSPKGP